MAEGGTVRRRDDQTTRDIAMVLARTRPRRPAQKVDQWVEHRFEDQAGKGRTR